MRAKETMHLYDTKFLADTLHPQKINQLKGPQQLPSPTSQSLLLSNQETNVSTGVGFNQQIRQHRITSPKFRGLNIKNKL